MSATDDLPEPEPERTPTDASVGRGRPGRSVVLTAIVAGGLAGFACSGRSWRMGDGSIDPITGVAAQAAVAGTAIAPGVRACSLAVLAGVIAVLLVRGRMRVLVAVVLTVVAAIGTALAVRALAGVPEHFGITAWVWLSIASCLLATVGGVAAVLTCRGWSSSRSMRYDAPGIVHDEHEDPWQALDRGDDPTL